MSQVNSSDGGIILIMADVVKNYWSFLNRQPPDINFERGIEVYPNFFFDSLLWGGFFSLLFLIASNLFKSIWPGWYNSLTPRKQKELPSYVVCLVHHFIRVPGGWINVFKDFFRTEVEYKSLNYAVVEASIGPFCMGYFIGDLVCFAAAEALKGEFEYLIHHVVIITIISASVFQHSFLCRWIPHLLICDTTNLFFNCAWLLRTTSLKDTILVQSLEIMFAISFLFTRVINMPCFLYVVATQEYGSGLGWYRLSFIPLALLQWYWFSKVVVTTFKRIRGPKAEKIC